MKRTEHCNEDVGSKVDAGVINVIYGRGADGLGDEDNRSWHQDGTGVEGEAEHDDTFGFALR